MAPWCWTLSCLCSAVQYKTADIVRLTSTAMFQKCTKSPENMSTILRADTEILNIWGAVFQAYSMHSYNKSQYITNNLICLFYCR